MSGITITRADYSDIERMRGRVRQPDVDELRDIYQMTPEQALEQGLEIATHAWTMSADGEPICMMGIYPMSALTGLGILWMVSTTGVDENRFAFARASRRHVDEMLKDYDCVLGAVSWNREPVLEWAKWLGFSVCDYTRDLAYIELRRMH